MTDNSNSHSFSFRLNKAANAQEYTVYAIFRNQKEFVLQQIANDLAPV